MGDHSDMGVAMQLSGKTLGIVGMGANGKTLTIRFRTSHLKSANTSHALRHLNTSDVKLLLHLAGLQAQMMLVDCDHSAARCVWLEPSACCAIGAMMASPLMCYATEIMAAHISAYSECCMLV